MLASPSEKDFPPHGLWSLWDMFAIKAKGFVSAMQLLGTLDDDLRAHEIDDQPVPADDRKGLIDAFEKFQLMCTSLGARLAALSVGELRADLQSNAKMTWRTTTQEIRTCRKTLERELGLGIMLFLNVDESNLFTEAVSVFGDTVVNAFPSAVPDIDEAGKCLAVGRAAATVFHLMRVAEIAVRAIGHAIGITEPSPDWGEVIRQLDDELKTPKKQRKLIGDPKFLAGVSNHMHAVKLAWRNQVMHVDATFSLDNARDIFSATRALMQHLAEGGVYEPVLEGSPPSLRSRP